MGTAVLVGGAPMMMAEPQRRRESSEGGGVREQHPVGTMGQYPWCCDRGAVRWLDVVASTGTKLHVALGNRQWKADQHAS